MSSSTISTILILGLAVGAGIAIWKRCDWFGMCGDIAKDIEDTIKAVAAGGLTSISSGDEVAAAITDATNKQGHPFQITKPALAPNDPSVKLAGSGPLSYKPGQGLTAGKSTIGQGDATHKTVKLSTDPKNASGVVTSFSCPPRTQLDASNTCKPLPAGLFARAMMAEMTVTGGRMSYF